MADLTKNLISSQIKKDVPLFKVGDIIKVYQEIEEAGKKRLQPFEGLVIAKKHGKGINATFMLRRKISGIGTEKIFPLYSPLIKKIEIIKRARRPRKAKLYWVRKRTDREIQKKLRLEQHRDQNNTQSRKKGTSQSKVQ